MKHQNETTGQLILDVTLFDNFQIIFRDKIIEEADIRSEMVTKLLAYLICHRGSSITVQTLSEVLWGEEECSNPVGALKNLMYRLRSFLKANIGDYPFIITGRGTYSWNSEIQLNVDAERFEEFCRLAEKEQNSKKRIEYSLLADSLYKEKFLQQYSSEYWVMSLSIYYHSLYLNMIKALAEDLESEKRFFEMEEVCHAALTIDELDEDLHYYFIRALMYDNKRNVAMEHYQKVSDLLYDSLGVNPSARLRGLYDEMLKQQHTTEMDISKIKRELHAEKTSRKGAFICDYGIFKSNYELEMRRAKRLGVSVYLGLITLIPRRSLKTDTQAYKNIISLGMKQMQNVLMESLRSGDVITRYSAAQFIMMLPACDYRDADRVVNRVIDNFNRLDHRAGVRIEYSLDEMDIQ